MTGCASVWWIPLGEFVGRQPGVPLTVISSMGESRLAQDGVLIGIAADPPGSLRQQGLHLLLVAECTRPVSLLPPGSVLEGGEHWELQGTTLISVSQNNSGLSSQLHRRFFFLCCSKCMHH